jgi:predicted secreted Zn-dependent protease
MNGWLSASGRRLSLCVAAVILAAVATPASAELKYTTVYKDHLVQGATPQAVWQYMIRNPINDPDDGPALANITHAHKLTFDTGMDNGVCKVSNLTFNWNFVITLPKAVDQAKMSPVTAGMWQEFLAKAKWHEAHRHALFLDCAHVFVPAAEKMTAPTCFGLDYKVRRYVNDQYTACMAQQRQFGVADGPAVAKLRLIRAAEAASATPTATKAH